MLESAISKEISDRRLYATDASVYRELPDGVAWPESSDDCIALVNYANNKHLSLIPRAAGTSIAGQCVGNGIVVDISRYMTEILDAPHDRQVSVQPGVILDDLNIYLEQYSLKFAPDTSTSSRCMVGGMIGNNAAGSYSVLYGSTRDHVNEVEVVLSDGSVAVFGPMDEKSLREKMQLQTLEGKIYRKLVKIIDEHRDLIFQQYPKQEIVRRNTGYALDILAKGQPWDPSGPTFNIAPLICGSEGTLALVTKAILNLVEVPKHRGVVCVHFDGLHESMVATVEILKNRPAAIELIDKRILDLSKDNMEQSRHRFWIEGDPAAVLVVEFFADSVDEIDSRLQDLVQSLRQKKLGYAYQVLRAEEINSVWSLRKAGLGLLMGVTNKRKPVAVIEDTAVLPEDLPGYLNDVQAIMRRYDVDCVFYGHASVGLLHFRPELDLSDAVDKVTFTSMAQDMADLVKQYGGSLSGEHGDGRVRGPFLRQMIGDELYQVHKEIKHTFDPHNIFNPGKILTNNPIDSNLRTADSASSWKLETGFDWSRQLGLLTEIDKCNGAGACRKQAGSGVMCPSYQATHNELFSTRGRSNLIHYLFSSGGQFISEVSDHGLQQAMESCLACKACKSECPSNVDMARLKSEYLYQRNKYLGTSLQDRMVRYFPLYLSAASKFPVIANALQKATLFKRILGVRGKRSLPRVSGDVFAKWWDGWQRDNNSGAGVVLILDIHTKYYEPEVAIAAIKVLRAMGFKVVLLQMKSSPRQLISKGLLDDAKLKLNEFMLQLDAIVDWESMPVIGLEPAEFSVFKDEVIDLIGGSFLDSVNKLGVKAKLFDEYVADCLLKDNKSGNSFIDKLVSDDVKVSVHMHCHQKSIMKSNTTLRMLQKLPGVNAGEINTGCCGMAGQFGYEHQELSQKVAETSLVPEVNKLSADNILVSSGISCRHQIQDLVGRQSVHPAVFVASRMRIAA